MRRILAVALVAGCLALGRSAGPLPDAVYGLPPGALARLGPASFRHPDLISGFDLTPDGRTVVTCGRAWPEKAQVRVWDAATGRLLKAFDHDSAHGVAISPAGGRVAVCGTDSTVSYWNLATGERLWQAERSKTGRPYALAVSPDNRLVTAGSDDLTLHATATGEVVRTIERRKPCNSVEAVAFSPDGTLVAAEDQNEVRLWEVGTGRLVRAMKGEARVRSLAFTPDGKRLLAACRWGGRVWDVSTGELIPGSPGEPIKGSDGTVIEMGAVAVSPDGRLAAFAASWGHVSVDRRGGDTAVRVYRLADGALLHTLPGHYHTPCGVKFGPDSPTLAVAGATVRFFDASTGQQLRTPLGHQDAVADLRLTSEVATTAGLDGTVRAWNPRTGQQYSSVALGVARPWAVALSPDGRQALAVSRDLEAVVTDTRTGVEIDRIAVSHRDFPIRFTASGTGVVVFHDKKVTRHKPGRATTARPLSDEAHVDGTDPTGKFAWWMASTKADRKRPNKNASLIDAGGPYELVIWDAEAGREVRRIRIASNTLRPRPAISPDGQSVAIVDEQISVYALATGVKLADLGGTRTCDYDPVWTPDGKRIAFVRSDCLECWDVATGRQAFALPLGGVRADHITFSPDGKLVGAATGTTAVVWELPPPAPTLKASHAPPPKAL